MSNEQKLLWAIAEAIASYREHQTMLAVGGHEPRRVNAAIDNLSEILGDYRSSIEES